jgi:hypothetical protein
LVEIIQKNIFCWKGNTNQYFLNNSFQYISSMAGAALVVRFIIVRGHIYGCPGSDVEVTIFEKKRIFLPRIYLHLAGDKNRTAPTAAAEHSLDNLVYPYLLAVNLNQLPVTIMFILCNGRWREIIFREVGYTLGGAGRSSRLAGRCCKNDQW